MASELTIVDEAAVRAVATRAMLLEAVEAALVAAADGAGEVFPVAQGRGSAEGSSFSLKSGRLGGARVGFKCGTYWPGNRAAGLPAHGSTTLLLDPATGFPLALVAATGLNALRTAAADAAAVRALARADARVLALVGAGHQAEAEVRAVAEVRPIGRVLIWNRSPAGAERLRDRLADLAADVAVAPLEEAVRAADILVTVTASRAPLVEAGWVRPGTHISAMGADQPGKRELDPALWDTAALFADLPAQAVQIGELQGRDPAGIVALGEVIAGRHPGRRSADEVTLFDSSGIALQDLAAAAAVLEAADAAGLARRISF